MLSTWPAVTSVRHCVQTRLAVVAVYQTSDNWTLTRADVTGKIMFRLLLEKNSFIEEVHTQAYLQNVR